MEQYVSQHGWLFYLIALALAGVVGWLIKRFVDSGVNTMKDISNSVSDLYGKYNNHEHRLSTIEGEHRIFTQIKKGHGE